MPYPVGRLKSLIKKYNDLNTYLFAIKRHFRWSRNEMQIVDCATNR